jgi:hypothetical protein
LLWNFYTIESFGGYGIPAQKLIKRIAKHASDMPVDEMTYKIEKNKGE